jgi:nitrate/TMAO reductase-like tetraheme cytochrome c subunit
MRLSFIAFALTTATVLITFSEVKAETFPMITNQVVKAECGSCHMVFPPQTLPKASWAKIMSGLTDHFGEDASLDASVIVEIRNYHVQNASDVSNVRAAKKWWARGVGIRLTEAPRFIKKHATCVPEVWAHEQVKTKANCLSCHPAMDKNGSTDANIKFLPLRLQRRCGDDD